MAPGPMFVTGSTLMITAMESIKFLKEAALVKSREVVDMTDDEGSGTRGRGGRGVGGASVDGASVGSDTREGRGSKARLGKEVEEEMDGERGEVAAGKVSGKNSQKLFL